MSELPERFGTEVHAWGEAGMGCAEDMGTGERDGVVAVSTRHGLTMVERVGKMSGGNYGSIGQVVRRFYRLAESQPELGDFVERMRA